ncbi:MerR family transcriptional regulator [Actinomadura kijaniata]|uniref:MerR family transcriptional regulator n=1 Tax=Actinomadura kijaniata TaxID=46161 RepID=UPI003F1A145B
MSSPPPPGIGIGEMSRRTGLSIDTLRFYEREGLMLGPVRRTVGGTRRYHEGDVEWIGMCVVLRAAGMPLTDIRRYTELVRAGAGNEAERLALLREHRDRIAGRMEQLSRCLDLVDHKVAVYEDLLDPDTPVTACAPPPAAR